MTRPTPRKPTPSLAVDTIDGPGFTLADSKPERFTLVVFYRGLHCPICRTYLSELDRLAGEFESRGVAVVAVSSDTEERARQAREDWRLGRIAIGYGMSIENARQWGLYVSTSRGKTSTGFEEPALFNEPGVFLVRPDGTLYWSSVQSMPFARPHFDEMIKAIDFVVKNDYPGRGEA